MYLFYILLLFYHFLLNNKYFNFNFIILILLLLLFSQQERPLSNLTKEIDTLKNSMLFILINFLLFLLYRFPLNKSICNFIIFIFLISLFYLFFSNQPERTLPNPRKPNK